MSDNKEHILKMLYLDKEEIEYAIKRSQDGIAAHLDELEKTIKAIKEIEASK